MLFNLYDKRPMYILFLFFFSMIYISLMIAAPICYIINEPKIEYVIWLIIGFSFSFYFFCYFYFLWKREEENFDYLKI